MANQEYPVKLLIVANMKVPMSLGQIAAQVAHAAVAAVTQFGRWGDHVMHVDCEGNFDLQYWLQRSFTKVVCKAWGDEEMNELKAKAKSLGLPVVEIVDYGHLTAIAIGPADKEKLKAFKDLPLL